MAIYKLGDIAEIIDGKKSLEKSGNIPVIGAGGIFSYTNEYRYNKETFSLPRKGTMKIFWYNFPVWNIDTAFLVGDINKNVCYKKYLYYFLLNKNNWEKIITGSTRPGTKKQIEKK
ncbi:MAG: restriction endonuclease subunit S [Mycoplasma sp.]|nr:restriction endonuclease subunit S [Mycoplasma sp.]